MSLRYENAIFPSAGALAEWRRRRGEPAARLAAGTDDQWGAVLAMLKKRGLILSDKVTPRNFVGHLYAAALTKAAAEGKGERTEPGLPPARGDRAREPVGMSLLPRSERSAVRQVIDTMTGRTRRPV
jgi:hypothetical protein